MAQSSDSGKDADILTIVNGSKEYKIPKRLICSKIPYFEKICSSNFKESVQAKVELNLDEGAFDSILQWTCSESAIIGFDVLTALRIYACADYLMIASLKERSYDFFWDNFTIENSFSDVLDIFRENCCFAQIEQELRVLLCRCFDIITFSNNIPSLPFEFINYLCNVDAPVSSEAHILIFIEKWVRRSLKRDGIALLMKTIRWIHVSKFDLKFMLFLYKERLGGSDENLMNLMISQISDKLHDRRVENRLIAIFSVSDEEIELCSFSNPVWTTHGIFKKDDNMSISFFDETRNKTDAIYECGRKLIRIDWSSKTFRYHDLTTSSYYNLLFRNLASIVNRCYLFGADSDDPERRNVRDNCLILKDDDLISSISALIHYNGSYSCLYPGVICQNPNFDKLARLKFGPLSCLSARDRDGICVISNEKPASLNIYIGGSIGRAPKTVPINGENLTLHDLELISFDAKIFVVEKPNKKIYIYNKSSDRLKLYQQIYSDNNLITVTSASIPKAFTGCLKIGDIFGEIVSSSISN